MHILKSVYALFKDVIRTEITKKIIISTYKIIGPVWVNNLIKHLFYKSLLDESLCYKYFI